MEDWRRVWRVIKSKMSSDALTLLRERLTKTPHLVLQGSTTTPPPLVCLADCAVEAACPIATCGLTTLSRVGEIEEFFARMCYEVDKELGEPAGVRHFINWWDDTPRSEVVKLLLEELQ